VLCFSILIAITSLFAFFNNEYSYDTFFHFVIIWYKSKAY
jgi:hypothetical protein